MILVTSRQIYADLLTVRRFSAKRALLFLLSVTVFFSCFAQASSNSKIIETGKITMTGNRVTETTSTPAKRSWAFSEKIIVTSPIVLTGSRKKSP